MSFNADICSNVSVVFSGLKSVLSGMNGTFLNNSPSPTPCTTVASRFGHVNSGLNSVMNVFASVFGTIGAVAPLSSFSKRYCVRRPVCRRVSNGLIVIKCRAITGGVPA